MRALDFARSVEKRLVIIMQKLALLLAAALSSIRTGGRSHDNRWLRGCEEGEEGRQGPARA